MSFPTSPANNQTALVNGVSYVYNQTKGAWLRLKSTTQANLVSNTVTVLNSILFSDGTSQTTAATGIDSYARTTANSALTSAQAAFDKANTAITTSGQLSIRWIEKDMNKYLNKILKTENEDYVIACDTDSMYLSLDKLVSRTLAEANRTFSVEQGITFLDRVCETKLQPVIDSSFQSLAEYTRNARCCRSATETYHIYRT